MKPPGPLSTYRLQLHAGFTFEHARLLAAYLQELGVSDVYVSPILRAQKGSTHGYDVCAHDQISPELGGEVGFCALSDELRSRGLRLLVDFVPNHMGIGTGENAWWNDVLENGPSSRFADHFDIDWDPGKGTLQGRVLYPILEAQFGEVLENREILLARSGGVFSITYRAAILPVTPRSLLAVYDLALERLGCRGGSDVETTDPDVLELLSIRIAVRNLPAKGETGWEQRHERAREKEVIKGRLDALCSRSERVAGVLDEVVAAYNGTKGDPRSFDRLEALLAAQCYRLSYWRVASEEINYRRFFDINQLAALRMEAKPVFEGAHATVLELIRQGRIDGLRLDHTDGLYDPAEYFATLRDAGAEGLYVVAEKILEQGERLPREWKIDGTTGYDALSVLAGLWVDAAAEPSLTALYRRVTGDWSTFESHVGESKQTVIRGSFGAEINVLARKLERIAEANRRSRDFTLVGLRDAIVETVTAFPVYRTYVRADGSRGPNDDRHVARAVEVAKRRRPQLDPSIFDFLRDTLLLRTSGDASQQPDVVSFAMRYQQLTGPIMAKGVEDTAFYRYVRLVALNDVGGDPSLFGTSISSFHESSMRRRADRPRSMVATSTHDTKRGEDVRARLAVVSEQPETWARLVDEWELLARRHQGRSDDEVAPAATDRYLFFQTVLGAWPFRGIEHEREDFVGRIARYMQKAVREAKTHTSWLNPSADYESATEGFVRGMLTDEEFLRSIGAFAGQTATYAAANGLAQAVLKLAGPGVADIYQGRELWDFSLVDPDSRRPIDYAVRAATLRAVQEGEGDRAALSRTLLDRFADGAIKLYVTHLLLTLRRERPELLLDGEHHPLEGGDHAVAFTREGPDGDVLACVVPRLSWKLTQGTCPWPVGSAWGTRQLALPARRWRNVFTGARREWPGQAPVAELLETFPVAVLLAD